MGVGNRQTLSINRATADIGYVLVKGHLATKIGIDNLRTGPMSRATSGPLGQYQFLALPSGTYSLQVNAPGAICWRLRSPVVRVPPTSRATPFTHIDFGLRITGWQNPRNRFDVNDDGFVNPLDALIVLNAVQLRGLIPLTGSSVPSRPFIDVNGDEFLSPVDILQVINYLSRNSTQGGEGELAAPP